MQTAAPHAHEGDPRRWLILAVVSFAVFMAVMDISIVNISLPSITRDLGTDFATATWVLNAYNLTFAVLLVTAGRMADLQGRRRWLAAGILLFGLSSLACALSPSISALIGFRIIQAAGAAVMLPVALAIVVLAFPPRERGTAIGAWGAVAAGGAAAGPPLGGIITDLLSWHWIFAINVPVCLAALVLALRLVPESRDPTATGSIDWPGILTLSVSLFALNLALVRGEAWGWGSARIVGLFAAAAVLFAVFVASELRVREPIVDLRLFRSPAFGRASAAIFLLGLGLLGSTYGLAVLLQTVWEYSPLKASFTVLPFSLCAFLAGPIAGRLSDRIGVRVIAAPALTVFGLAVLGLATLGDHATPLRVVVLCALAGLGVGGSFPVLVGGAMATVAGPRAGVGSGVVNVVRQVGFVVGVAVVEATLQTAAGARLDAGAFVAGFVVCGLCGLGAAAIALAIPRPVHAPPHHG
ncbi:MAG: DHA2 family efflux MFS transporter permease subunit [Thermoleophilia bacterium]